MKTRLSTLALLATASTLTIAATMATAEPAAKPMFGVLPAHGTIHQYAHAPAALQTWNGTITYNARNYNFTMVGTNPASNNTTTTMPVFIIPVKMVYSKKVYGKALKAKFDPNVDQWNGASITQSLLNSPLFNNVDWNWGGTDFGATQYEDGFQRGSFWGDGVSSTNTAYHVVFGTPTVLAEQTIKVSKAQGGNVINNPFGAGKVGEMNINAFDAFIQTTLSKFSSQITPSTVPIFVIENVYLTSNGCCIGGYHSADNGGQTYMMASFVTSAGAFSQDISAFSHEMGEWYDDPLITSQSPCGLLEVGDPIEGLANYGDFNVNYNGITWHPQALAWMEYFGEPANFSGNNWLDNQHLLSSVCQNGS
jgi:hypothetical protein